ncbi:hypothetical protein ZIOFF_015374 [Zingiber officinale]|uniref:Uncharacterized protein n=1 Tax=Zingiber officinale TaxID=94328 RepID=A0A8J5LF94_ZINOF|nr:hypothetical protein ZIOFF_015374 [Zingiber officinale]
MAHSTSPGLPSLAKLPDQPTLTNSTGPSENKPLTKQEVRALIAKLAEQPKLLEKEALKLTEELNKKLERVETLLHKLERNIQVSRGLVGRLSNGPNVGFAYEIQGVVDYLTSHGDEEIQSDEETFHTLAVLIKRAPGVLAYADEYTEEYEQAPAYADEYAEEHEQEPQPDATHSF